MNKVAKLIKSIEDGLKYKYEVTQEVYDYEKNEGLTVAEITKLIKKLREDGYSTELIDMYSNSKVVKTVLVARKLIEEQIDTKLNADSVRLKIQSNVLTQLKSVIDERINYALIHQTYSDVEIALGLDGYQLSDSLIKLLKEVYEDKGYKLEINTDDSFNVVTATLYLV